MTPGAGVNYEMMALKGVIVKGIPCTTFTIFDNQLNLTL